MQIAIPNSESGVDTTKLIEDLLEAERQPAVRLEQEIEDLNAQKNLWRETDSEMELLEENARQLYSFNSPFKERAVESSEPLIADAEGKRGAIIGEHTIYVKHIAGADRWLSQKFPNNYNPPQGDYIITIGEKVIDFKFSGNTIESLIETINRHGRKHLKASILRQGSVNSDKVVLLESLVLGEKGKMTLKNQAETFGKEIKLIGIKDTGNIYAELNTDNIIEYISKETLFANSSIPPITDETELKTNSFLTIKPGGIGKIELSKSKYQEIFSSGTGSMNIDIYVKKYSGDKITVEDNVSATLQDVTVKGIAEKSLHTIPHREPNTTSDDTEKKVNTENLNADNGTTSTKVMPFLFSDKYEVLYSINGADIKEGYAKRISIPISDVRKNEDTVIFTINNPFPTYKLIVGELSFSADIGSNELVPLQAVERAQDAVVNYNGIDLSRDTNSIEDVVPGVVLNLKRANPDTPVVIQVTSDEELIKNSIIAFVGSYNQLIKNLNIFTKTDPEFLDTLQFNSEEEKERAEKNLGAFTSEFNIRRFMTRLQVAVSSEYNNTVNEKYSSLRSIGIASNIGNREFNLSTSQYLDIDEEQLDSAIATDPDAMAALFGVDTNNDVAIDYGVAFNITEALEPYVQVNGITTQKQNSLQAEITRDEKTLETYDKRLERYEADLRRKFGNMERTIEQLRKSSSAINNFTNNNNNN